MLDAIHGKEKAIFEAAEDMRKAIDELVKHERDLALLLRLRNEDPKRHLQATVLVNDGNRPLARPVEIDVPLHQAIMSVRNGLASTMGEVHAVQGEIMTAFNRLVEASKPTLETVLEYGGPMVGPGRVPPRA